jgi:hypothetical protein
MNDYDAGEGVDGTCAACGGNAAETAHAADGPLQMDRAVLLGAVRAGA